jgi:hypothetical protein
MPSCDTFLEKTVKKLVVPAAEVKKSSFEFVVII